MKKVITFDKKLEFKSMIGEITSISLEHNLKFVDQSNIEGNFFIAGTYKLTEASQIEEDFSFELPVEIALPETIDLETSKIEIDDFNYEIENEDIMVCHIDVLIQGVEEVVEIEEVEKELNGKIEESTCKEERECDGDIEKSHDENDNGIKDVEPITEPIETNLRDEQEENISLKEKEYEKENMIMDEKENKEEIEQLIDANVGSLFSSFRDEDETFATYSIYIVRGNETIEEIMDKYKVKREQLEDYNDLTNIQIGSKLIIPTTNE